MTLLVVLTVLVSVALIAGLACYLYWAGTLLDRIGANLEGAAEVMRGIKADAELIGPAWSTSTRLAAWSPAPCRCCTA